MGKPQLLETGNKMFITNPYRFSGGDLIATGLVHHYKLDEGSGTTIEDNIGSQDGTLVGATWSSDVPSVSPYSNSVEFDGNNDYAVLTAAVLTDNDFTADFSVALWGKRNGDDGFDGFFTMSDATDNGFNISFRDTIHKQAIFSHATSGFYSNRDGAANASDYTWHHMVFVSDGGTAKFYFDGVLQAETGLSPTTVNAIPNLGRFYVGVTNHWLDGRMSDLRIYDRVLSSVEISSINAGTG